MNNLPTLYKESIFKKIKKAIFNFFKKEPEIQLDIKPNNTVKIEEIVQPKNISIVKEKNNNSVENNKIQENVVKKIEKEVKVEDEEKERE